MQEAVQEAIGLRPARVLEAMPRWRVLALSLGPFTRLVLPVRPQLDSKATWPLEEGLH